jgi:hypothetical protein
MPDRDVKTIRDLIYYQYVKIIARRAFGAEPKINQKRRPERSKDPEPCRGNGSLQK